MIEFTDRYDALGIPRPDPATVCAGQCEGTGFYPVFDARGRGDDRFVSPADNNTDEDTKAWESAHAEALKHICDGWHFVTCPECNGTGKRQDSL